MITLERFAYIPPYCDGMACTLGNLTMPSGRQLATMERPWDGNQQSISCIPEGIYELRRRHSPVVDRSTGGAFIMGWEIIDVPERSLIMIHPANWAIELEGCISVGIKHTIMAGKPAVTESRNAFRLLMAEIPTNPTLNSEIHIRPYLVEYP